MTKSQVVYVNFNDSTFIDARKRLLSGTIDTIELIKRYKLYKVLKVREAKLRNDLKKEINDTYDELNLFIESIPKLKEEHEKPMKEEKQESMKRSIKEKKKKSKLDAELFDIKQKLASLG